MAQIQREGRVSFGDASLSVWEEGLLPRTSYQERDQWEKTFKRQVFARIVQTLNRLGWQCQIPEKYIEQYSLSFARDRRRCQKGDLHGFLEISGRSIDFKMWQSINTPNRPDHGGQYEPDKEAVMPYLIRIEMERTRRRIRDYLCNVFDGYAFNPGRPKIGLNGLTAFECAAHDRKTTGHYVAEFDRARISNAGEDKSADGCQLENGARVFAMLHNGRIVTGNAFYSLNGNWQIVTGRYEMYCVHCKSIWVSNPGNLRQRRDKGQRRKRLEAELSAAIKAMNFERAATLRDLLFPKAEPLYVVWHSKHNVYHRTGFAGYTANIIDAGKFTAAEVEHWNQTPNEVRPLELAA